MSGAMRPGQTAHGASDGAPRVLVTGATGFVGRVFCASLAAAGFSCVPALRRPCAEWPGAPVVGEIGPHTDWREALEGVDAVVHLASRVHLMQDTASDPLAAYRAVNSFGTIHLARQAASAGVRRFVFASSVKVNGEGRQAPYRADDTPSPLGGYAVSKWEAESGLFALSQDSPMEVVAIRLPLVYGPGVGANFLRLMDLVGSGLPLPFGCVENRRSLVFLGNAVDLMIRCLTHPGAANRVLMISDGDDVSTPTLLRKLGVALGRPARLLPVPVSWLRGGLRLLGKTDLADRLLGSLCVDLSETRSRLGWEPPYSIDEGLAMTAQCYGSGKVRGK